MMHLLFHGLFFAVALATPLEQRATSACTAARSAITSKSCASAASKYCSSYLSIGTTTITTTAGAVFTTTATVDLDGYPTWNGNVQYCIAAAGSSSKERRDDDPAHLEARIPAVADAQATATTASTATASKPACLSTYKSSAALSSACGCLSISKSATTTTTTIYTSTATVTTTQSPTASSFYIQDSQGNYALPSLSSGSSESVAWASFNYVQPAPYAFTLNGSCILTSVQSGLQFYVDTVSGGGDVVEFTGAVDPSYSALTCVITRQTYDLQCIDPIGTAPPPGYWFSFENSGNWFVHITNSSNYGPFVNLTVVPIYEN